MLILAVDTSTRTGSTALLRDTEVIAEVSGYEEVPYSSRLFRDVALLQDRAGFRINEIDVFAVAAGPGSFTGLRIGLTAVKAWSEAFGRPVVSVSSLEAIGVQAFKMRDLPAGGALAAVQDARRGQVFGCVYENTGAKLDPLA